ncbi:hypothetical protein HZ326_29568 [Fusarium oxysporum f. sp. albedinis]|nr:hypothetical protein HZ326_29568 [Fusarium oxysporum f. sp. albedinis]
MLDLLEALGVLICSGQNGHQRGCESGKWVGGSRYAQACDCAWTFGDEGSVYRITAHTSSPEGAELGAR